MWLRPRAENDGAEHVVNYVDPQKELNAGLWSLFAGATVFLCLRLWCKITRRHGLWWDDYILIAAWSFLLITDTLISYQYATGYVPKNGSKWDDRMHILINISSCTNVVGQAWSKSAFGVTLLKLTNRWGQGIIWFCIITTNIFMITKNIFQWAKLCGEKSYDVDYRLDFCIGKQFRDDFKEAGNIYNIVMDFVFALFPWVITWRLTMRRAEKIGLCITMSLGIIVAIVAAVRTAWKDEGNKRDPYYYWRNGVSNVWYSSEVAGTILVQCIPILRTFISEIHSSLTSQRLNDDPYAHAPNSWSWSVRKTRSTNTTDSQTIYDSKARESGILTSRGFDFDEGGLPRKQRDSKGFEGSSGSSMSAFNFGFGGEKRASMGHGIELRTIHEVDSLDEEEKWSVGEEKGGFQTKRIRLEDC